MERRKPGGGSTGPQLPIHLAPVESRIFANLTALVEHLVVCRYSDGTPRRTGRMFLEVQGAGFRIVLKEPDMGLELPVSGQTLDDVFAAADLILGVEDPPWIPDPWQLERLTKRRR